MSLPLTILSARWNRRKLVLALLAVFIVGNLLSALSDSFISLMLSRLCVALAHAIFWAIVVPLAARIVPPENRSRAVSFIVTGTSLAVVLGVPIGTLLGQHLGWRTAFGAVAVTAACVLIFTKRCLPSVPSEDVGSLRSLPELARNGNLLIVYLLTLAVITGHFGFFTYFSPFMQQTGGFSPEIVPALLLVFGASGIVGGILGGIFSDKPGKLPLLIPLAALCLMTLIAPALIQTGILGAFVLCSFWGALFTLTAMTLQLRVLSCAPTARDVAISIYSAIFNVGIGCGALLGSWVFKRNGVVATPYASAIIFGLAALLALFLVASKAKARNEQA